MREILFRGYCSMSSEWVFGDLIHGVGSKKGNVYILPNLGNLRRVKYCEPIDGVQVDPKSVGQYTGIIDSFGARIFEKDILEVYNHDNPERIYRSIVYFPVDFVQKDCRYASRNTTYPTSCCGNIFEVVGNIFDSRERPAILKIEK